MASVVNETQVNFNPSWMQSVAKSDRAARMDRTNRVSVSNDEELMPPVFAKNRYGREDILALIGKGTKPPDGLDKCPFFVESPQAPIILQQLSEIEERLQQNINSSKALSSLPKSRQQLINGGASPEVSSHPNAGWVTAGSGRGGTVRTGGNRWSGLGSGSSSGNGPGNNESNPGYRPGRGNLMRVSSSGGHGSTANENMAGMGNRWSGLANPINTVGHEHTSGYRPARGGLSNATGRGAPASLRQVSAPQSREPEKTGDPSHLIEQQEKIDHSPPLTAQNETEKIKLISTSPALVTSSNHFGAQSREPEKIVSTSSSPNLLARPAHSTSSPTEEPTKPTTMSMEAENKWYYLDPTDTQQGPFDTKQMMLWFQNSFFKPDLRVRSTFSSSFTTLGDLMHLNGRDTPFVQKSNPTVSPRPDGIPISQPVSSAFSASSIWGPPTRSPPVNQSAVDPEADKIWEAKQRQLAEEARKLKEKEEILRREEQERIERERLMVEKERELARKQEEISRMALEREAKLRREQEDLLNRERQLAEFERQKMEELEREKQRLHIEMQRQKQAKEEEEHRKQREIEQMIEREREKQRLEFEEKLRREQEEKEESLRRAYEEMQEAARKKADEEKTRRQREEEERKLKARFEEDARKEQFEKERLRQIANERQQGKKRDDSQQKPQSDADFEFSKATAAAPWVQISTKQDKAKEKQIKQENRTLAEIQEEELREMRLQHQKQAELVEQQKKQVEAVAGVWGKPATKIGWNAPQSSVISHTIGSASKKPSPIGPNSAAQAWNVQPTVQPVPIPPAPQPKANNQKQSKQLKKNDPKLPSIAPQDDEFTKWIIKRVRELNPTVDAEVFATFIESVDSPDEAEDYIVGYMGDSKEVKAFHRELINKRIELRSRTHVTPKDDLSRPAVAATKNVASSTSTSTGASNSGGGGKKKKKGKGNEKIITGFTGFKPVGDPNRFNAGEIDTTPPVPNRKR